MNKNTKELVPKLRFPEFRDVDEWKSEAFEDIYDFKVTNSFSRDMLNYENGSVKNIHYGDIHTKFSTLFDIEKEQLPFINPSVSIDKIKQDCYCVEGDMVFADASEDLADVGKSIELVNLNGERLVSGLHTILARQKKKIFMLGFGGHLFKSQRIRKQIQKESQGAKVLGLSSGRLARIKIAYPSDKKEQQKIADCLSSIDDLITAQSQKVEALKIHKKGLMQKLFPREGETVPRLRFPEFRDAGEWVIGVFDNAVNIIDGDRGVNYPKAEEFSSNGFCVFLNAKNVTKNGFAFDEVQFISQVKDDALRKGKLKRSDVILTTRGSVGHFAIFSEDISYDHMRINSGMVILRPDSNLVSSKYLYSFCKSEIMSSTIEDVSYGNAQQQLTVAGIKKLPLYYPKPEEQQKIADCLSSNDELISAQSQKLETLKTHKKGLMQQLFPGTEADCQ